MKASKAALRKQLAKALASILANPETPTSLYNSLSDEVLDLQSAVWNEEMDTERNILRALDFRARAKASMRA
jgi:hypothetical protein